MPQAASVGRIVHVYNPKLWDGARPGVVVGGPWGAVQNQVANVNVFLDGLNDQSVLAQFRARIEGNTFGSIPVRDPLNLEERAVLGAACWAEFPPKV